MEAYYEAVARNREAERERLFDYWDGDTNWYYDPKGREYDWPEEKDEITCAEWGHYDCCPHDDRFPGGGW